MSELYYDEYEEAMAYGLGLSRRGTSSVSSPTASSSASLESIYPGIFSSSD